MRNPPQCGQGACSAIEDAGALADLLDRYAELPAALSAYDELRRPATGKLVRRSRLVGAVGQVENRAAQVARDAVLTVVGRAVSRTLRRPRRRAPAGRSGRPAR